MSNEQLKHIFDSSACLTQKQMRNYVAGSMTNEEVHAAEVHLNSCPMCSDAADSLFEQQEAGLSAMQALNADFLKDHFGNSNPQIHLNTFTTAHHTKHIDLQKKKAKVHHLWRTASIAAGLLLLAGILWYYRVANLITENKPIAQEVTLPSSQEKASVPAPIAMNEPVVTQADKQPAATDHAGFSEINTTGVQRNAKVTQDAGAGTLTTAADVQPFKTVEEGVIARNAEEQQPEKASVAKALTNARAAERVEDMPVAAVPRSFGNSYNTDAATGAAVTEDAVKTEAVHTDKLDQAGKLYETKRYNDALNIYLRELNNTKDNDRKDAARIGAAQCYLAIGDTTKAKVYLMAAFAGKGRYKREAKRMLKNIADN